MAEKKTTILVVDDEVYMVHILDFSLGMEGYEVITALDGEGGLEQARKYRPDVIITDDMMPKMDGYEFTRRVKGDPDLKATPVIMLGVCTTKMHMEQAREAGVIDFVSKPFSPRRLVERVATHLAARGS